MMQALAAQWLLAWLLAVVAWIGFIVVVFFQRETELDLELADDFNDELLEQCRQLRQELDTLKAANAALQGKAQRYAALEERQRCVQALYDQQRANDPRCAVQVLSTFHGDRVSFWPVHLN